MARKYNLIASLIMMALILSAPYAAAETLTSFRQSVDFDAIGSADEVQNAFDPNSQTNYDTWDPVPSGVWYGGYPVESLLRHTVVPDDDFSIAMATVCMFGPEIIMSGASRTLVRLPVSNDDANYNRSRLLIYEISRDSNWTFSRDITVGSEYCGYALNDLKVNFTAGEHELIFFSQDYDPTDTSPTDGNDHFSRSGRTYAYVDAPLEPGVFYLFINMAWYDSDQYVNIYLQSDTLTDGEWNRSTIATYNEVAPDTYDLQMLNFNASFGYSFDFQNGFGNSAYGLNVYAYAEDEFKFFTYVDPDTVDDSHFLTFMMPYRSTVDNLSWEVSIYAVISNAPDVGTLINVVTWDDYICRDFILISMADDWDNNASATALGEEWRGWLYIKLTVHNDTRLRFPLWNTDIPEGAPLMNASYEGSYLSGIHDSDDNYSYNMGQWIRHDTDTGYYNYFWTVQHSVQFNSYQWTRHVPDTGGGETVDSAENMTFGAKVLWCFGQVIIQAGDVMILMNIPGGAGVRAAGVATQLYARYGEFPDWAGRIWDKLVGVFTAVGQWLWRAAQALKGAFDYFLNLVSVVLGVIILFLSIGIFAFMIIITFHSSMSVRLALMGDLRGAAKEMKGVTTVISKAGGAFK